MNRIKQALATIVYYHISLVGMGMLVIGAIGAGVVILLFEFRTPVPADDASQAIPSQQVKVSSGILDHITAYKDTKIKDRGAIPSANSAVFYVPPKAQ